MRFHACKTVLLARFDAKTVSLGFTKERDRFQLTSPEFQTALQKHPKKQTYTPKMGLQKESCCPA
jgi:hypothetical protein